MSSDNLDSDTRLQRSRQSALTFAWAAWEILIEKNLNLLFSPYSLYRALAVPAVEATPKFREPFLSALGFPVANLSNDDLSAAVGDVASNLKSHNHFVLRDVNHLWINAAFEISENRFNNSESKLSIGVSTVLFPHPAIEIINDHIKAATDGMIPAALSRGCIDTDTAFLITNALYLHGDWVTQFDPNSTRLEAFTRFDRSKIQTQIMRAELTVSYAKNDLAELVFLPYDESSCEFVAILPRKRTEGGFRETMMALNPSWLSSGEYAHVHLRLPKFRATGPELSFKALAEGLGLKEVFETEGHIFPQPEGEPRMKMCDIKQQVVIEVDESGTRAAVAGIGAAAACKGPPLPKVRVNLDRPFAFLTRNRVTETILLMGTYLNPR
jgi:serpin B